LAWKLAAVLRGRARDGLLDSYEAERIGFARRLVATTDRAFKFVTAEGAFADIMRTRVAPIIIPAAFSVPALRKFAFRTVSQTMLNYRGSSLNRGAAGHVQGGDRLPWVAFDGTDNYAALTGMDWQVHVYGSPSHDLSAWCAAHNLPLHAFPWKDVYQDAGLVRNALYLLRPDTYVALADGSGDASALERYFADLGITTSP